VTTRNLSSDLANDTSVNRRRHKAVTRRKPEGIKRALRQHYAVKESAREMRRGLDELMDFDRP
jgi:hypothetical protein